MTEGEIEINRLLKKRNIMNKKFQNIFINILYVVFSIFVFTGAYLKLQHNPFGTNVFLIGLILGQSVLIIDNMLLKKKIKELEKKNGPQF